MFDSKCYKKSLKSLINIDRFNSSSLKTAMCTLVYISLSKK